MDPTRMTVRRPPIRSRPPLYDAGVRLLSRQLRGHDQPINACQGTCGRYARHTDRGASAAGRRSCLISRGHGARPSWSASSSVSRSSSARPSACKRDPRAGLAHGGFAVRSGREVVGPTVDRAGVLRGACFYFRLRRFRSPGPAAAARTKAEAGGRSGRPFLLLPVLARQENVAENAEHTEY
jgi:hypothetical protein